MFKSHADVVDHSFNEGSNDSGSHSQYRANYPIEYNPHVMEDTFFKSLESNTVIRDIHIKKKSLINYPRELKL